MYYIFLCKDNNSSKLRNLKVYTDYICSPILLNMAESTLAKPIDIDMYYVMFQLEKHFNLDGFSDLEKQILKLFYTERKSFFEIAELLSLEKLNVGAIYFDCMEKLKQKALLAHDEYFLLRNVQQENNSLKRKIKNLQKLLENDSPAQKLKVGKNILKKKFFELDRDFDFRTAAALTQAGIPTFGDVILYSEADLLRLRNMGTKSVNWLKAYLEKLNLSLSKY